MRIIYHEARRLVKVEVLYDGHRGWTLNWGHQFKVFRGDLEEFAKFLARLKAKDDKVAPASHRSLTYRQIAQEIADGTDRMIWIWDNDLQRNL